MKKKLMLILFISFFLLVGCAKKTTMIHETFTIYENSEEKKVMMMYPQLNIEKIDQEIEKEVQDLYDKTMENTHLSEANVNYLYNETEEYVSFALSFISEEEQTMKSMTIDKKTQKALSFDEVFKEDSIATLAKRVDEKMRNSNIQAASNLTYHKGLLPKTSNFDQFYLGASEIVFYFDEGQCFNDQRIHEVRFTYEELADLFDIESTAMTLMTYDELLYEPVKLIDPNKPMVALTFDDGPNKYTDLLLDALLEYRASATSFVLGNRVERFPKTLQRMVLEGNEIGNHTMDHKQLTKLTEAEILREVEETQNAIESIVHIKPKLVRPPYGERNTMVRNIIDYDLILWDLDTRDWASKDPKKIVEITLNNVRDGDIILMHDIYSTSVQAAIELIPLLQEKGYQLVTVTELLTYRK